MRSKIAELQRRIARLERQSKIVTPFEFQTHFEGARQLSKVDPDIAQHLVTSGDHDDDKIEVRESVFNGADLQPSQTTMVLSNTVSWCIKMLSGLSDLNLGAIVSRDGFIMDGHHRWSAAVLAYGSNVKVSGYKADMDGENLLRVLNIVTKGHFGVRNGNHGKGSISDYTPRAVAEEVARMAREGDEYYSANFVRKTLEDNFGSVEEAIRVMSGNVKHLILRVPDWAPDRVDMPVISSGEVPDTARILNKGEVQWNPPYREVDL